MPMNSEGRAVLSYGSYLEVMDPATHKMVGIAGLSGFEGPQVTRGEIDVTRLDSKAKEYVLDLKDNGTITATLQTLLGSRSQQILVENLDSTESLSFLLHLPDDGMGRGEVTCGFDGRVSGFPISGASGQVLTTSLSVRITGDLRWTYPDDAKPHLMWSTHILNEDYLNDGAIAGVVSVTLHKAGTFAGTVGGVVPGVTFTSVPAGLTGKATKVNNTTVYLSFEGKATAHDEDDAAMLTVSFGDTAFSGGASDGVANCKDQVVSINFK